MEQWWTTVTVCFVFYFYSSRLNFVVHSCLGHVVNLGNIDIMGHITKIAAVENATAIWEYDPTWPDNRVLGGSLDVIAAIRTLAIKVRIFVSLKLHVLSHNIYMQIQASGQHIEYFHSTQIRCGVPEALKIPLHSNIRWGTAFKMLDQANKLRQVRITIFIPCSSRWYLVDSRSDYLLAWQMRCMAWLPCCSAIIVSWNTSPGLPSKWSSQIGRG